MFKITILYSILLSVLCISSINQSTRWTISSSKYFQVPPVQTRTFDNFIGKQNKIYRNPAEGIYRALIYKQNVDKINQHNDYVRSLRDSTTPNNSSVQQITYALKMNKFGDLSQYQFRLIYTKSYPTSASVQKQVQIINSKMNQNPCVHQNISYKKIVDQISINNDITYQINYSQKLKLQSLNQTLDNSFILNSSFVVNTTNLKIVNKMNALDAINTTNSMNATSSINLVKKTSQNETFPTGINIDWTNHSGPVKYQGLCGACYAFASVDSVAALNSIYTFGFFLPLSIQQVIDCSDNGLTFGCQGGYLQGAYSYIQYQGLTTQFAYNYAGVTQSCLVSSPGSFKIKNFTNIEPSCNAVIDALKLSPLAIGIAGYRLQFYSTGIFNDCNSYIDHAVLLVGYVSQVGWRIKNTWGADWGESGYAWIQQDGNNCGICLNAVQATIPNQTTR